MEIILALIAIGAIGYFFWQSNKKSPAASNDSAAPYKVETPVPTYDVTPPPSVVVEGAGAVELPATPVAEAAPAKKPRKPRAPKAEKPAAKKPKKTKTSKAK